VTLSTETTIVSSEPAPSAEVVQPEQQPAQQDAEGTGASEQTAETEDQRQQREASEAGRKLAQRRQNQANAFQRISRRIEQLEAQNLRLQEALLARAAGNQEQSAPTARTPSGEPRREDFGDYDDYLSAVAAWRAEKIVHERLQEVARTAQQFQQLQQRQAVVSAHTARVQKYAAGNPEFDQAIAAAGDVPLPDAASDAITRMEDGPRILHEIAKNPQIALELHRMSPPEQLLYLGQMSAVLRSAPQISKAPPPGNPVGSKSGAKKDVKSMTRDEYYDHITASWRK
jgi:hypothetical protein